MAENIYYNKMDISDEERETSEEEEEIYKQIKLEELSVVERERKSLICESCVSKGLYKGKGLFERVAVFLCFACEIYVCVNCLPEHKSHNGMNVWRKESERENGGETSESDRMGEQGLSGRTKNKGKGVGNRMEAGIARKERETSESERLEEDCDRKISLLLDDLMAESETERIEKFENSPLRIIDRVGVKHELDQAEDCWITGLCILENKRLVVCDYNNYCIKIFKLESHVLQRYIRFVGSEDSGPWDVTEIDLKQNSTEPNLVSGSSSDISVTDRTDPDKQCLIAVTLPGKRQIMFIDLSKKPAKPQKVIQTEGQCRSIQFYDDKIFTGCRKGRDSRCFVYIYPTDGDTPDKFYTGIYGFPAPDFAVVSGRVYITDRRNNKVQCRNVEGQLISEITIEGSVPIGISVDPDNNVYVCAWVHNNVYKLDADLTRYKSLLDQTTVYIEDPSALCYYRDKLFINHGGPPSLRNSVTVVRLL